MRLGNDKDKLFFISDQVIGNALKPFIGLIKTNLIFLRLQASPASFELSHASRAVQNSKIQIGYHFRLRFIRVGNRSIRNNCDVGALMIRKGNCIPNQNLKKIMKVLLSSCCNELYLKYDRETVVKTKTIDAACCRSTANVALSIKLFLARLISGL
jgi:hypothetical protein